MPSVTLTYGIFQWHADQSVWMRHLSSHFMRDWFPIGRLANSHPFCVRPTQLPLQNLTIWVRTAWDFCPIFNSLLYVIIERKIAPSPISRNCPTLRLASLSIGQLQSSPLTRNEQGLQTFSLSIRAAEYLLNFSKLISFFQTYQGLQSLYSLLMGIQFCTV